MLRAGRFAARRAEQPPPGNRHAHVVDAVIGEELGAGVELVAVPARFFEHADLREPLGDEVVRPDRAGAGDRARNARGPGEFDVDGLARAHRRGQRDVQHRPVVRVPVVGRHETGAGQHVDRRRRSRDEPDGRDVDGGGSARAGRATAVARERRFAHPGGAVVTPRVVIQVERQGRGCAGGDVAPRQDRPSRQGLRAVVEPDVDGVAGVAR